MNEELTKIIDVLAQKLGVASQSKMMIASHLIWLAFGIIVPFIAYEIFMVGVNKCKEHNRKVDEDYNRRVEIYKSQGKDPDYVHKGCYDNVLYDEKYMIYWVIPLIMCIASLPMLIYGVFVLSWVIAPTGSTINYLLGALK